MSRPFVGQQPKAIFASASMASTIHSVPQFIGQMSYIGFDISWAATGSPNGTFSVEVSNSYSVDATGKQNNAGNWTALTLSQAVSPTGSAGNAFIDIDGVAASWIRLTYTPSSGTGTMNAYLSGKVI